jgi:ubiquinone/menaquinone biosynthesis C-methylase UbiE
MENKDAAQTGREELLGRAPIYRLFLKLIGGDQARQWIAENFWSSNGIEKVVDIGCGLGDARRYLPENISYCGLDISENYIRAARKRFSNRDTFILADASSARTYDDERLMMADLVLCNGLLHHLSDDDAITILESIKKILRPRGRLVCIEATYLVRQGKLSKWVVSLDRGEYVRSESEWKELVRKVFPSHRTHIVTGLIRIPYTHIIIECANQAAG